MEKPLNGPQFDQLSQLDQKRIDIGSRLAEDGLLAPELKAAYERGLTVIDSQISELIQRPDLQEELIAYSRSAAKNLEGLQPLEGILPQEELNELRVNFEQRLAFVREFVMRHTDWLPEEVKRTIEQHIGEIATVSAMGQAFPEIPPRLITLEPVNEAEPAEIESTAEILPTNLILTVHGDLLQIGKQGKVVPLSRHHDFQTDYSQQRLRALKTLVEHEHEELSPHQIWFAAAASQPFDHRAMTQIRKWFDRLTFRGQPLVVFNAKRGSASRYWISPNFHLEIQETVASKRFEGTQFTMSDLYIAARHLEQFNPVLEDRGIPTIKKEVINALQKHAPDLARFKGNEQAIWSHRQTAFSRAERLLDHDELFNFLDQVDESSAEYKFVEYLFNLEAEQRQLLSQFMGAKIEREVLSDGCIRFWVVSAKDRNEVIAFTEIIDREPSPITHMVQEELTPGEQAQEPVEVKLAESHTLEAPTEKESTSELAGTEPQVTYDYGEIEAPKRAKLSRENRQRLDAIRDAASLTTNTFLEHFNPNQTFRRTQLEAVFRKLTRRIVANAVENNVGPSAGRGNIQRELSIHDVVNILIYSDPNLRNIYTSNRLKKQAKWVIAQTILQKIRQFEQTSR